MADDVVSTFADAAGGEPLSPTGDTRRVVADPHVRYFGAELDDSTGPE